MPAKRVLRQLQRRAGVSEREKTFALLLSVLTREIGDTGLRGAGLHFRVSRGCTRFSGVDLQEPRTP